MADDEQQPLVDTDDERQPLVPKRAGGPSRGLVFVAVFGAALLLGAAVSARGGAARQQALRAADVASPDFFDDIFSIGTETCSSPTTEGECLIAAIAAGLAVGGAGYNFAGAYGSGRGCYTYTSNAAYVGIAYWSTSGDPTNSNPGSGLERVTMCSIIDTIGATAVPDGCEAPSTELVCYAAALAEGLSLGGAGYNFAGDYGSGRGCYTYSSGSYAGIAYWSTSGDPTHLTAWKSNFGRPTHSLTHRLVSTQEYEHGRRTRKDIAVRNGGVRGDW